MSSAIVILTAFFAIDWPTEPLMCADQAELRSGLIDWYQEAPQAMITNNIRLWASPKTGTWTVVMSTSNGQACTVAHGNNWGSLHVDDRHDERTYLGALLASNTANYR